MTFLALDIGKVRTGVAVSDPTDRVASPLKIISTKDLLSGIELKRTLMDYEDVSLLVGLPVSMDGEEHSQAAWVREIAGQLASELKLPLIYHDERRSSAQAESIMREMGYNAKSMRGKTDMVAASIFLQSYLDSLQHDEIGVNYLSESSKPGFPKTIGMYD
jgi:putative Holliday junction resolvase